MRAFLFAVSLSSMVVAAQPVDWVDDCGLEPADAWAPPVEAKPWEPRITPDMPPLVRAERLVPRVGGVAVPRVTNSGPLAGKVIYLSPGHGFTWTSTVNNWRTQRGNNYRLVEDLISIETLSQYLMPMLLNAGARVFPVRELDLQTHMVIVDDAEAGYTEQGAAAGFVNSELAAWSRPPAIMDGTELPFSTGGNRLMLASETATASARYDAVIPADGYYWVSVSYTQFSARVTDAHYEVIHPGGSTHFRVNQESHGREWVPLGRFYFYAGQPARVVVHNDSAAPVVAGQQQNVSLDAVKWGGGVGNTDRGQGISGRPRFEESARYYAQWSGAPASVWSSGGNSPANDRTNDVSTRSRYAAWSHEDGEDAVYVAWHTNALDGEGGAEPRGTSTYVYSSTGSTVGSFNGVAGSVELAQAIHGEIINDLRSPDGWNEPTWQNRNVLAANFGELNPNHNPETPAVLLEMAFHDTLADVERIREPRWRYIAARAITQGIIKYFAARDAVAVRLPPEPPTHLAALNQSNGEVLLRWREPVTDVSGAAGHAASAYRVYASHDGLSWDNGVDTEALSVRLPLPASEARFFRVTALNQGGESFPSAVVGARRPAPGRPFVLVVNGFDRLEAAIGKEESFAAQYSLGTVLRIFLAQMNDGSAARLTGGALSANELGFDTAEGDAVAAGDVPLAPYSLLSWLVGRGKQGGGDLSAAEQAAVSDFRARNVPVFFSGDAVGDATFLAQNFSGVAAGVPGAAPVTGAGPLLGVPALQLDDGTQGSFNAGAPPAVTPTGAAIALGSYAAGDTAAIGVAQQSVFFDPQPTGFSSEPMRRVVEFLTPPAFDGGVGNEDAGTLLDGGYDGGGPDPWDAGAGGGAAGGGVGAGGGTGVTGGGGGAPPPPVSKRLTLGGGGCGCDGAPALTALWALAVLARRRRR